MVEAVDSGLDACIDKDHKAGPNETEVAGFIGDAKGRDLILIDDMVDTGGSTCNAIQKAYNMGARLVLACASHSILSGEAKARFVRDGRELVTLDTIPRSSEYVEHNREWLTYLSTDQMLANAIFEASLIGGSVSKLSN